MRKFSLFLLILATAQTIAAQKTLPDFGEIDLKDLQEKSCPFEPGASAMKLLDVQNIEFTIYSSNMRLKTDVRVRIKIFDEKGYKHANIRIPYFSKRGVAKIKQLRAAVYNLDSTGKVIKEELTKSDFFKEKAIENVGLVNFTFPNLKPGSVIEYSYTRVENNILQISPWVVQGEIPVRYSSTSIEAPYLTRLEKKVWGTDTVVQKIEQTSSRTHRKTVFYKENIISFDPEPYMSSYKDNLMRVNFLLIPTSFLFVDFMTRPEVAWSMAGERLLSSPAFGGGSGKKKIPGTEMIIDSAKAIASIRDRIIFVYEAVKKRISEKSEQTLYPDDLAEAWERRSGNTAEINLILLNLLQQSGVTSHPLLVSTRDNGKVNTQFPSIGQMNGVDVLSIDSNKIYIMDASLKFQSPQNPPLNVLNRVAYLLDKENMGWIMVDDKRPLLKQVTQIQSQLKEDGTIDGLAFVRYHDYAKSYMLDSTIAENDKDKYLDKKPQGLKIISVSRENADNDSEPLMQTIHFTYEPQQTGDFYFINPQFFSSKRENPFIKDKRFTDIDFGCGQEITIRLAIEIPATHELDFLPKSIVVRAPDSSFMFRRNAFMNGNTIVVQQTFEIKESDFQKEHYPGIQEFFKRIYDLMNEEIVLKRKK